VAADDENYSDGDHESSDDDDDSCSTQNHSYKKRTSAPSSSFFAPRSVTGSDAKNFTGDGVVAQLQQQLFFIFFVVQP